MYYEDDMFDPNNHNFDIINNDALYDIKKMDKGYNKSKKSINKVWTDGKYYKNVFIETYSSGDVGTRIRNAATGQRYENKVGSVSEDLFFKVKDISGLLNKETNHLFYDTPEQYENHQYTILDTNIKEKWYQKNIVARQ
jgi:hypothetical protein